MMKPSRKINFDHLLNILGREWHGLWLVSVYAENDAAPGEAPRYQPVAAPKEGAYCVDDVARATVALLRQSSQPALLARGTDTSREVDVRVRGGLRFLLAMQARDGTFYNFATVEKGRLKINRTGDTSRCGKVSWWTARALWALAEGYVTLARRIPKLSVNLLEQIAAAVAKILPRVEASSTCNPDGQTTIDDAADVSGVVVKGLCFVRRMFHYDIIREPFDWSLQRNEILVWKLCKGIAAAQVKDPAAADLGRFYNDVNAPRERHLWGSHQVEALALAANFYPNGIWRAAAELCADNYWSRGPTAILAKGESEIAYGINSAIAGFAQLYHLTHKKKYATEAKRWGEWFSGKNAARVVMYDAASGRCFDGIDYQTGRANVNINSGAESTIEALLALQALAEL